MKGRIQAGRLTILAESAEERRAVASWPEMLPAGRMAYAGTASPALLSHLQSYLGRESGKKGKLPAPMEECRKSLIRTEKAVERERAAEHPEAITPPPVKASLFAHQVRAYNMALITFGIVAPDGGEPDPRLQGGGFCLFFEMGLGKSLTSIAILGAGWRAGAIRRVLVVAPASVCPVWAEEAGKYADFPVDARVLAGDKSKRLRLLEELNRAEGSLQLAAINYESAWREGILDALQAWEPDLVIADESQRIKDPAAKQSKAMHIIGDRARFRLALSGTPVAGGAEDLWSQYRFCDPSVFGGSFYSFRGRYCVLGGFERRKIISYKHLKDMVKREYSVGIRATKAEALDLPEQVFENRTVLLERKAREAYESLRRESVAELEGGESVTAATILTRLLRLQQVAGGFVGTDDGGLLQVSTAKLDALSDILHDHVMEGGHKVVVFCRFRPELDAVEAVLDGLKLGHVRVDGSVPMSARGDLVKAFQTEEGTKVFLAQIDAAGTGLTLTAADTCIYYSCTYSYGSYVQSLARIHRIGQRNKCAYIHLVAKGTVDEAIMDALGKKEEIATSVVDGWRKYFGEEKGETE